ncbi:hypothetical protein TcasGA2_TC033324 [Tribolium castaneum]|uniref:Uncharacterized protein n=1 Tax=Tribolium castaneum TaxID=7070 RepID=A0A139WGL0_TRICA|nr:hypothetical protein TcasGA2_TC033324 [Tribolium castaneum]
MKALVTSFKFSVMNSNFPASYNFCKVFILPFSFSNVLLNLHNLD